jgi:hypothetical protein
MLATLLGFVVAACVYDEGDRCDANQRLVNGRHCVCLEGYSMAQGGECIPTSSAAGAACDAENPCDDPVYSHCYDDESNAGYCTTLDCADSSDCAVGFGCPRESALTAVRRTIVRGSSLTTARWSSPGSVWKPVAIETTSVSVTGSAVPRHPCSDRTSAFPRRNAYCHE